VTYCSQEQARTDLANRQQDEDEDRQFDTLLGRTVREPDSSNTTAGTTNTPDVSGVTGTHFRGSTLVFNNSLESEVEQSENAAGQRQESKEENQNYDKESKEENQNYDEESKEENQNYDEESKERKARREGYSGVEGPQKSYPAGGSVEVEELKKISRIKQNELKRLRKRGFRNLFFNSRRKVTDEVVKLLANPEISLDRISLNYDSESLRGRRVASL
jgi:hypothetical protein